MSHYVEKHGMKHIIYTRIECTHLYIDGLDNDKYKKVIATCKNTIVHVKKIRHASSISSPVNHSHNYVIDRYNTTSNITEKHLQGEKINLLNRQKNRSPSPEWEGEPSICRFFRTVVGHSPQ